MSLVMSVVAACLIMITFICGVSTASSDGAGRFAVKLGAALMSLAMIAATVLAALGIGR